MARRLSIALFVVLIVSFFCELTARRADQPAVESIAVLLPRDSSVVDIMTLTMPLRGYSLANKMKEALSGDPQATMQRLMEKFKNLPPGEPLPYDPSFGLTEEEFKELFALVDKLEFVKADEEMMSYKKMGDFYSIAPGEKLRDLEGIRIDVLNRRVWVDSLELPDFALKSFPDAQIGAWSGMTWTYKDTTNFESGTATLIRFSLGTLDSSGRGLLTFKAKAMLNWTLNYRADVYLTFESREVRQE